MMKGQSGLRYMEQAPPLLWTPQTTGKLETIQTSGTLSDRPVITVPLRSASKRLI